MQDLVIQNLSSALEIVDEKLHSDEDIMCNSSHDYDLESRRNNSTFKYISIFFNLTLFSLNVFHGLQIFDEVVHENTVCEKSNVFVDVTRLAVG